MDIVWKIASIKDGEGIATLVNAAYRPGLGLGGWTHESDIIAGQRINIQQINELFKREKSQVIIGKDNESILACVHVEGKSEYAYIGMLAVAPSLQGAGVGKAALQQAEKYAQEVFRVDKFVISVIRERDELINFYKRRGYKLTGKSESFPSSLGVGEPLIDGIMLEHMEKTTYA